MSFVESSFSSQSVNIGVHTYFLGYFTQFYGHKKITTVDNSHIYMYSPKVSPEFQTTHSTSPLEYLIGILKLMIQTELQIFLHTPNSYQEF